MIVQKPRIIVNTPIARRQSHKSQSSCYILTQSRIWGDLNAWRVLFKVWVFDFQLLPSFYDCLTSTKESDATS